MTPDERCNAEQNFQWQALMRRLLLEDSIGLARLQFKCGMDLLNEAFWEGTD